jgi:hypothetical protein
VHEAVELSDQIGEPVRRQLVWHETSPDLIGAIDLESAAPSGIGLIYLNWKAI